MLIKVDLADSTPVYVQIMSQTKYAIATGLRRAGERVPSVRELAVETRVNPNTVARAYRELEREGILEMRRGLGLFVTADAPKICRRDRKAIVAGKVGQALREAVQAQLSEQEIRDLVESELGRALKVREPSAKASPQARASAGAAPTAPVKTS